MSIAAAYVSSTSFTVGTDLTADFIPGRAVRCDCGADGIKYAYVAKSSYSSPNTTVTLDSTDSQAITANLVSVMFSRVKFQKTSGNIPLDLLWMIRGMQTVVVTYKDSDEITLQPGIVHINDDTLEQLYKCPGFDKTVSGLSSSTWYAVYAKPPSDGSRILSASEIEYSSTMPTLNASKQGYYHGTNTSWRCIGFFKTNASSVVKPFHVSGGHFLFTSDLTTSNADLNAVALSSSFSTHTALVPIGNILVDMIFIAAGAASTALYYRKKGVTDTDGTYLMYAGSSDETRGLIAVNENKQFELRWRDSSSQAMSAWSIGFRFPREILSA